MVGTTAFAALMHNRKAIGAEIVPKYVDVALQRIKAAETGKLRIRPMERAVYDHDNHSKYIPPKYIEIKSPSKQLDIFVKDKQINLFQPNTNYNG